MITLIFIDIKNKNITKYNIYNYFLPIIEKFLNSNSSFILFFYKNMEKLK